MSINFQQLQMNSYTGLPHAFDCTRKQEEETLFKNVNKWDTAAGGKKDGKVGLDDLKAIANDKNNQSEEAKMVRYMLNCDQDALVDLGIAKKDKNGKLVNGDGADEKTIEQAIKKEEAKEKSKKDKPDSQDINGPKPKS